MVTIKSKKEVECMKEACKVVAILYDKLEKEISCQAKIRSTQSPANVRVKPLDSGNIEVLFENMQKSIAPGQSVVLYDGDIVLGGGIIL